MNEHEMIDALWHFFESVKDTASNKTAQICANLVIYHDFDVTELPETLKENVETILKQHYQESYYWSEANGSY